MYATNERVFVNLNYFRYADEDGDPDIEEGRYYLYDAITGQLLHSSSSMFSFDRVPSMFKKDNYHYLIFMIRGPYNEIWDTDIYKARIKRSLDGITWTTLADGGALPDGYDLDTDSKYGDPYNWPEEPSFTYSNGVLFMGATVYTGQGRALLWAYSPNMGGTWYPQGHGFTFDHGLVTRSSSTYWRNTTVADGDSIYLHYYAGGSKVRRIQVSNIPEAGGDLSLAPGASTTVPIRFNPLSPGNYTGTAIFETNAGTVPRELLGVGATPVIDVQPSILEFGHRKPWILVKPFLHSHEYRYRTTNRGSNLKWICAIHFNRCNEHQPKPRAERQHTSSICSNGYRHSNSHSDIHHKCRCRYSYSYRVGQQYSSTGRRTRLLRLWRSGRRPA